MTQKINSVPEIYTLISAFFKITDMAVKVFIRPLYITNEYM